MRSISDNLTAAVEALEFARDQATFAIETTSHITDVEQFLQSTIGMVHYNSACMCIQTIGESFRKADELTNGKLRAAHQSDNSTGRHNTILETISFGDVIFMRLPHECWSIDFFIKESRGGKHLCLPAP